MCFVVVVCSAESILASFLSLHTTGPIVIGISRECVCHLIFNQFHSYICFCTWHTHPAKHHSQKQKLCMNISKQTITMQYINCLNRMFFFCSRVIYWLSISMIGSYKFVLIHDFYCAHRDSGRQTLLR